jgi:hypothetical protein
LVAATFNLADKNHMVAFHITAAVKALKAGHSASKQRRAALTFDKGHVSKPVGVPSGKTLRECLLV